MMARFCAYIEKIFGLGSRLGKLTDARTSPQIPTAAAFASVLTLFATRRGSLNGLEQDVRVPRGYAASWGLMSPALTPLAASMP